MGEAQNSIFKTVLEDFKKAFQHENYKVEKVFFQPKDGVMGRLFTIGECALHGRVLASNTWVGSETFQRYANSALNAASLANDFSKKAELTSENAIAQSGHALHEADSFERDIVSVKRQAADAETHLAGALKQAADATAELNRLKSPRSLVNVPAIVTTLEQFKGTEYTFSAVFGDEESVTLLKQIDSTLSIAGWKRVKPPGGFPALNVYGRDVDFAVPTTVLTGVQVSIDSTESVSTLQALAIDKLPSLVKTAAALRLTINSNLSPAEGNPRLVGIDAGTSTTVRMMVGKKP